MPNISMIGLVWHRNGQRPSEQWHTDHTNRERPPAATLLHGVDRSQGRILWRIIVEGDRPGFY
jgi:hypothetical protein